MRGAWTVVLACLAVVAVTSVIGLYNATKGPDMCTVNRQQTQAIRNLIINGTKRSKALDPAIVKLGFPPYKERLKQAYKDANSIPSC